MLVAGNNQRDGQSVKSDPKVTRVDHLSSKCGIGATETDSDHESWPYHKVTGITPSLNPLQIPCRT